MNFKPIKKQAGYFLSYDGYVFKTEECKDIIITPTQSKRTKDVFVTIRGKSYNLLHLMMEYFCPEMKINDKYKFTITKDLRIPANSIRIQSLKLDLSKEDEILLYRYRCDIKANGANSRCKEKITLVQVYLTLKIHGYRCIYCQDKLHEKTWHLDHFHPISKQGQNIFENIVPSCKRCNIMKGAMDGMEFHKYCQKIVDNYIFIDDYLKNGYRHEITPKQLLNQK